MTGARQGSARQGSARRDSVRQDTTRPRASRRSAARIQTAEKHTITARRSSLDLQDPASQSRLLVLDSALGWISMVADDTAIQRLTFGHPDPQAAIMSLDADGCDVGVPTEQQSKWLHRLAAFAVGEVDTLLDLPIDESEYTPFQLRVIRGCRLIPYGDTLTYGELAEIAGSPKAARAVGTVMSSNRYPLIVPCHRVVGAAGSLGGYSGYNGLSMKSRLLRMEAAALDGACLPS